MDEKQRNIIIKFLIWCLSFFAIIFIGVSDVFAQTYTVNYNSFKTTSSDFSSQISCNNDICVVDSVTFPNSQDFNFEWGTVNSPTCSSTAVVTGSINNNKTSFGINNNDFNWLQVFLVNGTQYYNCSYSVYGDGTNFVCTAPNLTSNFKIGWKYKNNFGTELTFTSAISRKLDINCDTSAGQIIDNQTNNTQNIINNNNTNAENIINNQNQNTQEQIESQKVCTLYDKSKIIENGYLVETGRVISGSLDYGITDYINISNSTINVLQPYTASYNFNYCFYNLNKSVISCSKLNTLTGNVTIPSNAMYFRSSINLLSNLPQFEVCKNGNQALNDNIEEQTKTSKGILGKIGDLFNSFTNFVTNLFSTDGPDTSDLDNVAGWLPAGPVDSILTLPLSLINSILSGLGSSCSPLSVNLPYVNTNLEIPCINVLLGSINGVSTFYNWFGPIASAFILYYYFKSLYQWIDKKLSLKEDSEWGGV